MTFLTLQIRQSIHCVCVTKNETLKLPNLSTFARVTNKILSILLSMSHKQKRYQKKKNTHEKQN